MADHLSGYQARDWDVVDYEMYEHSGSHLWFRGPRPGNLERGRYVVCLGAAQTFGCFVQRPYPALLQSALGIPVVNLGYGGAGPRFYARHPELLSLINGAAIVIVQVMSARSEDNSRFSSGGLELLTDRTTGEQMSAAHAYAGLLAEHDGHLRRLPRGVRKGWRAFKGHREVVRVLDETREAWVDSYSGLMSAITAPTVLLWFSKRRPGVHRTSRAVWWWQRYDDVNAMFGDYPQLVTPSMVRAVRPWAASYVRCVSDRGSPQPLVSRFTGQPLSVDYGRDRPDLAEVRTDNPYYPSPEMHEDACAALLEPVRGLLAEVSRAHRGDSSGARA